MGAVDIGVERGEFIVEGIAHKALSRKVIAFVGPNRVDHPVNARVALERRRMQHQAVANVFEASQAMVRVLQRDPAHNAVDFVPSPQQPLR